MIKILDLGKTFGLPVDKIFSTLPNVIVSYYNRTGSLEDQILHSDLVCLGGGEDIHPELYGHRNRGSAVGDGPSSRDKLEKYVVEFCSRHDIPILGICRGAQLLCAVSGGKLIQDVGKEHCYVHELFTDKNVVLKEIASTHHQMMYINEVPQAKLLAWVNPISRYYRHDISNFVPPTKEPEIVLFPGKRLAIQGHPEWMKPEHETVQYCRELISEHLLNGAL